MGFERISKPTNLKGRSIRNEEDRLRKHQKEIEEKKTKDATRTLKNSR